MSKIRQIFDINKFWCRIISHCKSRTAWPHLAGYIAFFVPLTGDLWSGIRVKDNSIGHI